MEAPSRADHNPKAKYNVPMSLWLVEYSHRVKKILYLIYNDKLQIYCSSIAEIFKNCLGAFNTLKAFSFEIT
jgi:hypothetical protein